MRRKLTNRLLDELLKEHHEQVDALKYEIKVLKQSAMYDKRYIRWLEKELGGDPSQKYLKERLSKYGERTEKAVEKPAKNV